MPAREQDLADLALLSDAARGAGAELLAWRAKGARVWNKNGTPVTEADHASNALLHAQLVGARPGYGWLSEESQDDGDRLARARVFVVDPLDGTVSFIKNKDDFTVSLAVVQDGAAVVGVIYNPVHDELFAATRGGGATLNGAPIHASDASAIEGCRMVASASMFKHPAWREPWPDMAFMKIGSIAYRLALVAAGRADATVALSTKSDWDIAAGDVIAAEAGVTVTTHDRHDYRYNRPSTDQISLLAAPPRLHAALSARMAHLKLPAAPS